MTIATLTLPNGTVVKLEGPSEEIDRLLGIYASLAPASPKAGAPPGSERRRRTLPRPGLRADGPPDLAEIVRSVKNCDQAAAIERGVLDQPSQINRVLLPLYALHEGMGSEVGLTSGEIATITTELGVKITQPNASTVLSTSGSRYVMGDKMRKKGQPVRYRLSRRGLQHMKAVINGTRIPPNG